VRGSATEGFGNHDCRLDDKTGAKGPPVGPKGKKPPVFIGLGAVYNRKFEHSFRGPYIPAFVGLDLKTVMALSYLKNAIKLQRKEIKGHLFSARRCKH